ncbi:MAG: hypothetical protein HYR76_13625 [Ignavibacteria bacterium]|nr:hypothetical protein [Ignavibacteria bacterium]MBI3765985.1 hypothetical protein [Ignavibacteriales bacterium]
MGNEIHTRALAAMLFGYSLFEFLLRRKWQTQVNDGREKMKFAVRGSFGLFISLFIVTLGFTSLQLVLSYIVIAGANFLHESLRVGASKWDARKKTLEGYLFKQVLFVIGIFIAWRLAIPLQLHGWYVSVEQWLLASIESLNHPLKEHGGVLMILISTYLFVIDGGASIVRGLLNKFANINDTKQPTLEQSRNMGEWIGILERIITLTFVLTDNYSAIAFALTAKSIARFKELESDKKFAEYYLIGTSTSLAVAILVGLTVKKLIGM